jgi:hypothetical protein
MDVSLFELGERGVLITREMYHPYIVAWNGAQIFQLWKETTEPGRFESVDIRILTKPVDHVSEAIVLATAWLDQHRAPEHGDATPS